MLLERILVGERHQVFAAANGAQAVDVMRRQGIDLLITDVGLPDRSGLEVARVLADVQPGVPALLLSGLPDDGDRHHLPLDTAYLLKPFDLQEFLGALTERLATAARAEPLRVPC